MEKMRNKLCYTTSPTLTALHLLTSIVLVKQLGMALTQKNVCDNLIYFLSTNLKENFKNYQEGSMLFLAEFWRSPEEIVQSSAQELFLLCCRQITNEKRAVYVRAWIQRLRTRGSDESKITAALVLGTIAIEFPSTFLSTQTSSPVTPLFSSPNPSFSVSPSSSLSSPFPPPPPSPSGMMTKSLDIPTSSEPDVRLVCRELVKLINSNTVSLQMTALDLLGKGYKKIWRGHIGDFQGFIFKCFQLWQQGNNNNHISQAAKTALLSFAHSSPRDVTHVLTDLLLSEDMLNMQECTSALLFIRTLMEECTYRLVSEIDTIATAVVHYLEPASAEAKRALNELVQRYPMVSFHQGSQMLAVGTTEGTISVYDLKQAQRIHLLDPKENEGSDDDSPTSPRRESYPKRKTGPTAPLGITAVAFNSQGQFIAAYSHTESEIWFWQLQSMSFFGFSLRPQIHCSFTVPRAKFSSLDDVLVLWTSPRSVELRYGKNVEPKLFTI